MDIIDEFINQASRQNRTIVMPEGEDERILLAAAKIQQQGIARPILIGQPAQISVAAQNAGVEISDLSIVDPGASEKIDHYVELYSAGPRRTEPKIARRLLRKPLFFGAMMVKAGDADAMVAGAANPTARVIEAGLMAIGLAEGIETPSSFFVMVIPEFQGETDKALLFADCAVNADPNPEQLADIALASARSADKLLPEPARVALLSFSTKGSAKHAHIDKVTAALDIARQRSPDLLIDGELQADSALIEAVAKKKLKEESTVAGKANVLVFPDLNSGNISYKLTQYLADARAIGPFLQGFAKPVCDLSRGASVDDIVAAAAIALAQV